MSSVGVGPTSNLGESSQKTVKATEEMDEINIMDNQDMEDSVIDDNGSGAGHTIVTTIGGQNDEPKQDSEDSVIDDNGSGAGHTIVTTIGCKNGEPKQDPEDSVIDDYGSGAGHTIVTTIGGQNGEPKQTLSYTVERFVGQGSFGVVFQAKCLETGEFVAIKKVRQSKRFKNREVQTLRLLDHENIVSLKHSFFSKTERKDLYLNLVLEFVPDTVHRVIRHYYKSNQSMPLIYAKLYSYQILRALSYIHRNFGVCHRDIKPQNLLVNLHTHQVKVCDFGSAKVLVEGQPNISYICSRYYRAPELLFGATEYTTAVDMWSAGCVLGELLLGQPLFAGSSALNQVVEIIKVLGTPTSDEIKSMNPNYTEFNFPKVRAHTLPKIFPRRVPPEAIDLVSRLLRYIPSSRWTALDALTHPFFDDLRYEYMRLPGGRPLPPLFNFSPDELKGVPGAIKATLIPSHIRRQRQENRE